MAASPALNFLGAGVTLFVGGDESQTIVERWPPEGPSADVLFKCAWADRYTVVKYLRGGVVRTGKAYTYLRPASYPGNPGMLCTAIGDIRGIKFSTVQAGGLPFAGWGQYAEAVIPAHFSVPTWDAIGAPPQDPSGQPMTTTRFRTSAEIFAPPGGAYYYISGATAGKKVNESSVGVVRARVEISITRHLVPIPVLNTIMFDIGTVNFKAVTIGDRTFPVGCLMFAGCDTDEVADPNTGARCWDYTFTLMGNYDIEWNEFMDPAGVYVKINTDPAGAGDYPFEYENFGDYILGANL